jgi:hypothetical protein
MVSSYHNIFESKICSKWNRKVSIQICVIYEFFFNIIITSNDGSDEHIFNTLGIDVSLQLNVNSIQWNQIWIELNSSWCAMSFKWNLISTKSIHFFFFISLSLVVCNNIEPKFVVNPYTFNMLFCHPKFSIFFN